jgi:acyl transferase domain-containing protein/acyl-CoA synthetase (AMP-forming)/AMP-acid ligase II/acyl carrier protein
MSNLFERPTATSLIELLRDRAAGMPDRIGYTFLVDGETEEVHLTYADLDRKARAIAAQLQNWGLRGERALLLYPAGLEYIAAFFGCLYAGVVAVPAYPPRLNRRGTRIEAMVADARPAVALTIAANLPAQEKTIASVSAVGSLRWLATDEVGEDLAEQWMPPDVGGQTLAFLQYTSGSTGTPKGVMVTHGNLLQNAAMAQQRLRNDSNFRVVSWLPLYHDMGLIGGLLQTLYCGGSSVLLSPVAFLQRPIRWLNAISRTKANVSGAPNFAYDLCARQIAPEQRASLDLSGWEVALNGAEPVRAETLDRFVETFGPCGFRREAFYPSYGLAEATLYVAGGTRDTLPVLQAVKGAELEQNRIVAAESTDADARLLVGCGQDLPGQQIRIVDRESRTLCPPECVGEIWVSGPSVAQGYWDRPEESEQTFNASLVDGSAGRFLRTGDLGFLKDGELFVTGRLKDLIIIRGTNHYPQDIEQTAEQSHPGLQPGACAAFSIEVGGEEKLVIVAEVERHYRKPDVEEVAGAVRQAVAELHDLEVHALRLLKPGSLPRTSSGKVQRHACRISFQEGSLDSVGEWARKQDEATPATNSIKPAPTAGAIQAWLVAQLARRLSVDPGTLDVREPFARYGLDSASVVSISGELEDWLGRRFSPALAWEYPTIEALAEHLAGGPTKDESAFLNGDHHEPELEPVAIIGLSCRFPGARDADSFWRLLRDGVDAVREVPRERWDVATFYNANPALPGKMNTRWGGFLDDVDQFDPAFFGISPREAACMDPQQRILQETAWEALEDAGQVPELLVGKKIGVYIGISNNDYGRIHVNDPKLIDPYMGTGNAASIAANRLSYWFGFQGPSLSVDTACSSSLVALHLACRGLWNGETSMAMVGGVNLILSPLITISFTKGGFMSPDGRCKSFDARANGYVRSDGVGVVILKPLSKALADGDPIYAVIRGSAVNNDGRSNGLTAPSRQAQELVMQEACRRARVKPGQIDYVEAHGTGTSLGDLIEATALSNVLAIDRPPDSRCAIGSVKSNIGHPESASGMAGLIKVALAMKHQAIPASLHFQKPNPQIPFDRLPLRVQQTLSPWPEKTGRRLAGVSSFGFGGTNAHVIVEEAPRFDLPSRTDEVAGGAYLLPLSARSPEALRALAHSYREVLETAETAPTLHDLCYSASLRRGHHDNRLAVVVRSREELRQRLDAFVQDDTPTGAAIGRRSADRKPKIAFVFSGQGPQWWAMGRQLLDQEPVFRNTLAQCDELLRPHAGWSLLEELQAEETKSRLEGTEIAQPVLFGLQVALAALWRSWGIEPAAVVGHSMGEVAAAHVAGALSLADTVRLIYHRGRIMQKATGHGKMAAVEMRPADAEPLLDGYRDRLAIAAFNSPSSVVFSGETAALEEVLGKLEPHGIVCRILKGNYAFHSPQMEPLKDELTQALQGLEPQATAIPLFSTVTGGLVEGRDLQAAYWGQQIRKPVLFSAAIEGLAAEGHDVFVEISPHPVLCMGVTECLRQGGHEGVALPSLRRKEEDRPVLLASLGALYARGQAVDWARLYPSGGRYVRLPSYPWQRQRCWFEVPGGPKSSFADRGWAQNGASMHPLLGQHLQSAHATGSYVWEMELDRFSPPYLDDHRVQGAAVLPGAAYVEMALAAADKAFGPGSRVLSDVAFHQILLLPENGGRVVQLHLAPTGMGEVSFHIYSRAGAEADGAVWTLHATGKIRQGQAGDAAQDAAQAIPEEIQARCSTEVATADYYAELRQRGLQYGPCFQGIERLWRSDGEALGHLRVPEALELGVEAYRLHPAIFDAGLQVLGAAVPTELASSQSGGVYLPVHLGKVKVHGPLDSRVWSHASLRPNANAAQATLAGDVHFLDEAGRVRVEVQGLRLQRVDQDLQAALPKNPDEWLYELQWQPKPLPVPSLDPLPEEQRGRWILFTDGDPAGQALLQRLEAQGETCILVSQGESYAVREGANYLIDPSRPEQFHQLLNDVLGAGQLPCRGIVHLWGLRTPPADETTIVSLEAAQLPGCVSVLHLVQALAEVCRTDPPRLWLVTRGTQSTGESAAPTTIAQAPLWGLGRVIANEQPRLRCANVDLGPAEPPAEIEGLFREIWANGPENQVVLRGDTRHVARLARRAPETQPATTEEKRPFTPEDPNYRLEIFPLGVLDNLMPRLAPRPAPGPREVVIKIAATGLNFRDVMKAMGIYPGLPEGELPLGDECSGTIVAVGDEVKDLHVGDEVLAIAPACFTAYARTSAALVVRKPAHLSYEEAATIPIVFATAYHALCQLAHLGKGERVLIHAAAGGVGLAAVQIAQSVGAEVFATAGSPEKRQFLQEMGVKHIMDSRSLAFADEVMAITGGKGVDVVLNSLAGEFIPKSFSVLAPHGRFLEIGKRDLFANSKLDLGFFQKSLSFFTIDVERLCRERLHLVESLLGEIMQGFEAGIFKPLPHRTFSFNEVVQAFRHMAQGKHIGKLVLSMHDKEILVAPASEAPTPIRADGTYLITGGLGGLGQAVTEWLVRQGARYLVLMSRSGASAAAEPVLAALKQAGIRVEVARGDVASESDVARILADIDRTMPPLRGIVHAAGVLDDGILPQLDQERFRTVLAPKVAGAWNLHAQTLAAPLDFFVLFSSAASVLGSPGQGNYAAGNAFLDALAHYRCSLGRPALSINWGPWAEVGMAARGDLNGRLARQGIGSIVPAQGLRVLDRLLKQDAAQVGVMPINWRQWSKFFPAIEESPLLGPLVQAETAGAVDGKGAGEKNHAMRAALLAAEPAERQRLLETHLQKEIARVLGLEPSKLDLNQPLNTVGLDSLMAIELKNRVETSLGLELPMMALIQGPSIAQLATQLLEQGLGGAAGPAPTGPASAAEVASEQAQEMLAKVDQLDDAEVDALLNDLVTE